MTDKQAFLAKAHSDAAKNKDKEKVHDEELSAQIDEIQSADVLVLNELDWGMKRTDYRPVVKELAEALKMNWAYGVEFIEVDPKVLGTQSFANVKNPAERKELEDLFSVDKDRLLRLAWHRDPLSLSPSRCEARALQVSSLRLVQRREEIWNDRGRET